MGPYPKGANQNTHMLVVVDMFTRYVELFPLRITKSQKIIEKLWLVCCRWGIPRVILSDNGPQFVSKVYFSWCKSLDIKTFHISAYHPQANMTERYVQTVKSMILATIDNCKDWDGYIPELEFAIRTAVNDSTQFSPAYLTTGRELRTPFDNLMNMEISSFKGIQVIRKRLEIVHNIARDNIQASKEKFLAQYNKKAKERKYQVGDRVWLKTHFLSNASKGIASKLSPKREGPFRVTEMISNNIYDIVDINTGKKVNKVHINELSSFLDETDQDVSLSTTSCTLQTNLAGPTNATNANATT